MRFRKSLLCLFLSFALVVECASANEQARGTPTTSVNEFTQLATPTATDTKSLKDILRKIDVSGQAPDLIGISEVSDFYGPGAWSGWFLTLCGSWLHLFVDKAESRPDLNTWAFLAYINWAAVDLILHASSMQRLMQGEEATLWQKKGASVGAPMTVLFWAVLHSIAQMFASLQVGRKQRRDRITALFYGTILPVVALATAGAKLTDYDSYFLRIPNGGVAEGYIPAVYCHEGNGGFHLDPATQLSYALIITYCVALVVLLFLKTSFPQSAFWKAVTAPFVTTEWGELYGILFVLVNVVLGFAAMMVIFSESRLLHIFFFPWIIGLNIFIMALIPIALIFIQPLLMFIHLFHGYLRMDGTLSQCCYFMPCTSYSITDTSQAGSLFVGMILFFGGEVAVPLYSHYKRKREEWEELKERLLEADRKIEKVKRVNTVTLEEGAGGGGLVRRQASGLGGTRSAAEKLGISPPLEDNPFGW